MGRGSRTFSSDPSIRVQLEIERSLTLLTSLVDGYSSYDSDRNSLLERICQHLPISLSQTREYEEILNLLEADPFRFVVTKNDLAVRRLFLESALEFINDIKINVLPRSYNQARVEVVTMATGGGGYRYSRLDQEDGPSSSNNVQDLLMKQDRIMRQQDDELELVGESISTIKQMSSRIGQELDHQAIMLDELGDDMERVDTKLDGVMKKIAKLTNLEDGNKQCKAIIVLSILLFFLVFLLIVL